MIIPALLKKLDIKNQKILTLLILFDLFMAFAALRVDWSDFSIVPWYLWLFVPICPLYPFLLAINYFIYKKRSSFSQPLLHFTAIGILAYGIMAYLFYPFYMVLKGEFLWYEFGNILWVTLYAAQMFLLLPFLRKINPWWYFLFAGYYFTKDFLDRFSITYSYQRADEFTDLQANWLFIIIVILHLASLIWIRSGGRGRI